jgi:PAS domain S-box-containing protein
MIESTIKIILIDDEPSILDLSKQFLEFNNDISADVALSAEEALGLISTQDYDTIVSDYQMPGKDGIQLLKEIRDAGSKTAFILFTGKGREDVAIEALNAGADYYLQKGGNPGAQFAELKNMIMKSVEKQRIELDLKEKEERFKNIFNSANDSIHILDLDGRILEINSIGCACLGYTRNEMLKKNIREIDSEEYAIKVLSRMEEILEKGFAVFNTKWKAKDGRIIPFEVSARRIDYAGQLAILSVARDVTQQQRAQEALRKSEEKYRQLVESSSDGIFTIDLNAKINWANSYAHNLLGYSKSDLPVPLRKLIPFRYWHAAMKLFYGGLKGNIVTEPFELEVITKSGERIPVSYKGTLLHDESGDVISVLGVIREMSGSMRLDLVPLGIEETEK